MKKIAIYTIGALVGAAAAVWLWWAFQWSWWVGVLATLVFVSVSVGWLGLQFSGEGQSVSHKSPIKCSWIFVGASWICLTASVMLPLVCWFLIPRYRIIDAQESKALAERVVQLLYVEGAIAIVALFSMAGVRLWRPIGIVVRFVLAAVAVGLGVSMMWQWAFSLSFWR